MVVLESFRLFSSFPIEKENKVWAEIDLSALKENYLSLAARITGDSPGRKLICVIKADAYGHGAKACCGALLDAGARYFAVSCIEEAIDVRQVCDGRGLDAEILIMGYTFPSQAPLLAEYSLTAALTDFRHASALADAAKAAGVNISCHIKIDTGMNRLGCPALCDSDIAETAEKIEEILKNKNLRITGIFTHFSKADEESPENGEKNLTVTQFGRFTKLCDMLRERGSDIRFKHACNSAASLAFADFRLDACRAGILLYGACPSEGFFANAIKPVMKFKTVITHIHILPPGEAVSYGATFTADTPRRIATLPVGYADGFIRAYSGADVTVSTKSGAVRVPVIGRICMDQCMVDITGTDAALLDEVTLFGNSPQDLSALAARAKTIDYEVLCLVSARVVRKIIP